MVKKLAKDLRETWTPDADRFEADDDPDVVEPSVAEYVLKDNVSEKALASSDVKFHIINRAINSEFSLCGKIPLGETISFGTEPPGPICKLCETAQNRANGSWSEIWFRRGKKICRSGVRQVRSVDVIDHVRVDLEPFHR